MHILCDEALARKQTIRSTSAILFRLTVIAFVASLMSACVPVPKQTFLNVELAQQINRIAMVGPANPSQYQVLISLRPSSFTVVPTPLPAVIPHYPRSETPDFNDAMRDQRLRLGDDLKNAIASALSKIGYQVDKSNAPAHPELASPSDATLNLEIISAGYGPLGSDGVSCSPFFVLDARLEDKSRKILFRQRYYYGEGAAISGVIAIAPDKRFSFLNSSGVITDPETAAQGIRAGVPFIAIEIARRLAKKR